MINQQVRLNLFRFFSIVYVGYGLNYLYWRQQESLNEDALIFSYTLFFAEALMFAGSILMAINHWDLKQIKLKKAPYLLSHIQNVSKENDRPIKIDFYIATYNEPIQIVEETIKNAVKLNEYSPNVILNFYLCDDGKRDGSIETNENFKQLASKYDIHYLARNTNKGYKAGNLNHVFWQTDGDFIVILDADTIVYPNFIKNLLPYFRDEKMAWVQSPQFFYDIPQGVSLIDKLGRTSFMSKILFFIFPFLKNVTIGRDIFGTDPKIFYEVILYHRNAANAAFCCGAGSIHRREALESLIIENQKDLMNLNSSIEIEETNVLKKDLYSNAGRRCLGPFVHHISEDIYTSILMHANSNKWKSYQHPTPECKMLSPQSLTAFDKQFSRYAEGTFSIFFSKNNPIIKKGLTVFQRIAYTETLYSYFSAFWIVVFLLSPIIFYFTLIPPLKAFSFDFFLRFIILNVLSQILTLFAFWGLSTSRSDRYYIAGFWLKIRAFFKILFRKELKFNTTNKGKDTRSIRKNIKLVMPHLIIVALTISGLLYNCYLIINNLHPSLSAFWANNIWATYNIYQLNPIIRAAFIKN
jgi:cellulose synthase (UDP-forming)